jgi:hypothetical protein
MPRLESSVDRQQRRMRSDTPGRHDPFPEFLSKPISDGTSPGRWSHLRAHFPVRPRHGDRAPPRDLGAESNRRRALFHSGDCDQSTALAAKYEHTKIRKGEGLLGQAWFTGIPVLRLIGATDPTLAAQSTAAGLRAVIAMPFIEAGKLKAITAWYF